MGRQKMSFTHPKNWERKKYAKISPPQQPTTSAQCPTTSEHQTASAHQPHLRSSPQQPTTLAHQPPLRSPMQQPTASAYQPPLRSPPQQPTTSAHQPPLRSPPQQPTASAEQALLQSSHQSPASAQQSLTLQGIRTGLLSVNTGNWTVLSRAEPLQICKFDCSPHSIIHAIIKTNYLCSASGCAAACIARVL